MQCAMNLITIQEENREIRRIKKLQEELERIEHERKLDMEAKEHYENAVERTHYFCEEIWQQLEKIARETEKIDEIKINLSDFALTNGWYGNTTDFNHVDRLGNLYFNKIKFNGKYYANGEKSYNICRENDFNYDYFQNYFIERCMKVQTNERVLFRHYDYGCFCTFDITISINEDTMCL